MKQKYSDIKYSIIEELDLHFPNVKINTLGHLTDAIEAFLVNQVKSTIINNHTLFFKKSRDSHKSDTLIIGGNEFKLIVQIDTLDSNKLVIFFLKRDLETTNNTTSIFKIKGIGKINSTEIVYPQKLIIQKEKLIEAVDSCLTIGYNWLSEKIQSVVEKSETSLNKSLYSYLRVVLSRKEIWGSIWLGCMKNEKGFWLLDSKHNELTLNKFTDYTQSLGEGEAKLMTEFLTVLIDLKDSNLKNVKTIGEPYDFSILDYAFNKHNLLFALTEKIVFKSDSFTIFLFDRNDNYMFFAVYPTNLKFKIDHVLSSNRRQILKIFNENRNQISRLLSSLKKENPVFDYSKVGEFIGGFTKGLIDS